MDFYQTWYAHWYCGDLVWNFENGSTQKEEQNSFLLEFKNGFGVQESKQEVTEVVSP